MNDFGERLKDLRIQKDMTQEDVAGKLFVTKQAVSRWENGNCLPDVATLGKLAEIFDVNIDYLLTGNDNVKIEKEIEIVEKEKIVEVEKEKIVEVEKPLSDEMKRALLLHYQRLFTSYYVTVVIGIYVIILGISLFIICANSILGIMGGVFFMCMGGLAIGLGLHNKTKYKNGKEEIEKKVGKKVSFFKFKDK